MDNQILEKMQYLYSCGFVPDRWILIYDSGLSEICTYRQADDQPYFTESRLWSLLPNLIGHEPPMYIKGCFNHHSIGYHRLDGDDESGFMREDTLISFMCDPDLHTALLDLTIWAVKEGHLKAEGSNDKT